MITYEVTLTNEEVEALVPELERVQARLVKEMYGTHVMSRSSTERAYAALRKLFGPVRAHHVKLQTPVRRL